MNQGLFYDHVDLVFKIVHRMNANPSDKEDLIQAGLMGLHDATQHFNPLKGASFSTFATYYIMGAIKQEIRSNRPIKLSKAIFRILQRMKNINEDLSLAELCKTLEVSQEMMLLALNYKENVLSLNQAKDDMEWINLVGDESQRFDFDVIKDLDKISQEIILLKYYKNYTQKEIAKLLKLSQSKVSRLEAFALQKIKSSL